MCDSLSCWSCDVLFDCSGGQRVRGAVQLESPVQLRGSVDEYTPGSWVIALTPTLCQELPYCVRVHVRSVGAQAVEQVCATHNFLCFPIISSSLISFTLDFEGGSFFLKSQNFNRYTISIYVFNFNIWR